MADPKIGHFFVSCLCNLFCLDVIVSYMNRDQAMSFGVRALEKLVQRNLVADEFLNYEGVSIDCRVKFDTVRSKRCDCSISSRSLFS